MSNVTILIAQSIINIKTVKNGMYNNEVCSVKIRGGANKIVGVR